MTVRRAAGYFFVFALAVVSAVGLPCGAWLPYLEARISEGTGTSWSADVATDHETPSG
jgi:hypothetical protein